MTPVNGKSLPVLPIPTHLYKVIMGVRKGKNNAEEEHWLGAFILPNKAIESSTPLSTFQVPMKLLEALSGHEFFPALDKVVDLCSEVNCKASKQDFALMRNKLRH